ncbi:uncharacterized protein LOC110726392 [Chenopodium quinoa]|uniref:Uncharacterized protein n=1 Tax=Chenopodium quinoa TaxID=63459 RepID=A0A803M0Y0_CHEQI|nr:uncharacterized protein LOC110726392 [Chenopodium quinoa]
MQCKSYFPVYNSQYDLNVDANGGATPMIIGNGTFRSGHYHDYVPLSPVPPPGQSAYKEMLRRTMVLHEVAFKDQVQELHRLYRRQKELMDEVTNKELYMSHLQIEVQRSSSSSAKISSRCGQNTLNSVPLINSQYTPYSTGRDNNPTSLSFLNEPKPPVSPVASQTGGTVNSLNFAESKCKKVKGKLLDLELLAEMYIDSDEERSIEDVEFSKAPTPTTLPSNKRFKVGVETYAMASTAKRSLGPVLQGELLSPCSITGSKITLADLNEPLATSCLEESGGDKRISSFLEISEINHDLSDIENTISDGIADNVTGKPLAQSDKAKSEVGFATSGRKPSYSLGQIPLVVQALPSFDNQLTSSKGARNCGRRKGPINDKVDASLLCSPNFRVAKSLRSSCSDVKSKESVVCMSSKTSDLNCFDLNSVVMENSEFTPSDDTSNNGSSAEAETVKKSKICRMIDINLPCDFMTDEEPVIQDDKIVHDHENSGRLKLNFCMNDDSLQPKSPSLDKTQLEIDLEAPISPEVKERSPPRGDSEDNQSEEGSDLFLELAKIAADAIVSISSSSSQSYQENLGLRKCEASDSGNLEWFAGLINSLSSDLENDFDTMNCKDTCSIDDFEAMTLELPELKSEDFLCKSNVQISNETCLTVLPCQTRRGRTRRSKRKDFQREVLPSLASLSRYEVTEDIMMIEGLMEAAGTPWSLSKTRRACRTGRKPRAAKQPTFDEKVQELSALISWGKVNRRPRGRRSPASPTTISKWLGHDL